MSKRYLQFRTMLAVGAMLALAACGGNTTTTTSTGATAQATSVAESGAAETGTPASGDAASTEAATAEATDSSTATAEATTDATAGTATPEATTDTGTATTEAGTGVASSTPLTGPNISYGGVTFDVDDSVIPSVSVQSGAVNMMGMGSTSSTAGSGTLSGTIFTFEGVNMNASSGSLSSLFQPRILVIPVAQLVSYESAMMAGSTSSSSSSSTSAGATDTMTSTAEATTSSDSSTTGTATPDASASTTTTDTMGNMSEDSFVSELSRTISSQSSFASTAMSSSMVLTHALALLGFEGYTPAFQSNGEMLTFKNGRGVRFVTAFQQSGSSPAALNQLYYIFHGLTDDNRTYVMAIMPLQSNLIGAGSSSTSSSSSSSSSSTSSSASTTDTMTSTTEMTGTGSMTSTGMIEFPTGGDATAYQDYLDQVVKGLDEAGTDTSDAAFSQALQQFDTLIKSLNVSESAQ